MPSNSPSQESKESFSTAPQQTEPDANESGKIDSPKSPANSHRATVLEETEPDRSVESKTANSLTSKPKPPWKIVLGLILLLLVGYGGWRWWQTSQADSSPQAETQAQAVPVNLQTLQLSTVEETSQFIGSLTSRTSVTISPEIQGRVSQIYVNEGDEVQAGQPLVELKPDQQTAELSRLQAALNSAQAARANALAQLQSVQSERSAAAADVELQNEQYRRRQFLVEQGALAQEELDLIQRDRATAQADLNSLDDRIQAARANLNQAEAAVAEAEANVELARSRLQDTNIVAPFAGEVGNLIVKLGEYVAPGDSLTSVTQNDPLELELAVPVERRAALGLGLPVQLEDTGGNYLGQGVITFVSPQINANSQTILIQAQFPNPDGQLRDGQDVRARIVWDERQGVLVPTTAVTRIGGQAFVYVAQPANQQTSNTQLIARQVAVELGEIQNNSYPVLEGLETGDRVVVSGILNLSDGAPIEPQAEDELQILQDSE